MAAISAQKDRVWRQQPHASAFFQRLLTNAMARSKPATGFAMRLRDEAAVRIQDLVDHIVLEPALLREAEEHGWSNAGDGVWRNREGMFPALREGGRFEVWLRVESMECFMAATRGTARIEGKAHSQVRRAAAFSGDDVLFGVIERNGFPGFDGGEASDALIRKARIALQHFRARRREFDTIEQGLAYTEALVDAVIAEIGQHWACDLWLKAERDFWMRRCAPGRLQKRRQDAVGIGFANIDHHTYDGSRRHFRHTIRILEKLGYELREMLYAGELAGWGSQVLEQPVIGSTIFADVDLAPDELAVDFAHEELPDLPKHRRAGLVSALLGESILEAGLNHVACLYDQEAFRTQMARHHVSMMQPFTNFPHLYQELTQGDWAAVDPARIDALEAAGHIDPAEAEQLRVEGAVLSHLENIERNDGFKGFNREGIDSVLRKLDPRAYQPQAAAE